MKNLSNFINENKMTIRSSRRILRSYDVSQDQLDEFADFFDTTFDSDEVCSIRSFDKFWSGLKGSVRGDIATYLDEMGVDLEWFHAWLIDIIGIEI